MAPRISIIMPVLNGEKLIGHAIRSIVNQSFRNYELIVVDDGSTDKTAEQIAAFRSQIHINCIRHEAPQGIARSVNDGIRHAAGEMIAFLDHDDEWFPNFLSTQVAHLDQHPDVGMVHSDFQTIDIDGNIIEASVAVCRQRGMRPSGHVFPHLFMDSFIVGNSVVVRKECFNRLGVFDEILRWGDYHMWLRIARHYKVDYVDQVLTKYRQHSTQQTRGLPSNQHQPGKNTVGLMAIRRILETYPEIKQELGDTVIAKRLSSFYYDVAWNCRAQGDKRGARAHIRQALRSRPADPKYLRMLLSTLLPDMVDSTFRRIWEVTNRPASPRASTPAVVAPVRNVTES
jgi:glycosyltransferase involved in cell wall biosynthesis